jgi:DNA-directed RNA polymerase specialized sigma24 family protein
MSLDSPSPSPVAAPAGVAGTDPEPPLEDLVDRHGDRVRRAVIGALRAHGEIPDRERVEDFVQDVWCRLLERRRDRRRGLRGSSRGEEVVYLRRVAASVVVDGLRASGAAKRRPARLLEIEALRERSGFDPVDRRGCPQRRLLARDRLRRYLGLCRSLLGSRSAREGARVVRMAWIEGLTSGEIAARLGRGWTPTRVDSLLFRLRRRLAARGWRTPVRAG